MVSADTIRSSAALRASSVTTFWIIAAILSSHPGKRAWRARPLLHKHRPESDPSSRLLESSLLSEFAERFGQFGNRLIQIRDQAVVGDLENRRVLVLVDRDDHLGILHAREMLDRAGDADGDIELRRHHLAGLADLPVVRRIAGIDRRARRADAGAEFVGERLHVFWKNLPALPRRGARREKPLPASLRGGRRRALLHAQNWSAAPCPV